MKVTPKLKVPKRSPKILNPPPNNSYNSKNNNNENLNETHFISLIHNCKNTHQLQQIHAQIIRQNLSSNSRIITQLISSASVRKSIDYALSIFNCFRDPNLYLFNALIRGLKENSCFEKSVAYFKLMLKMGVKPDRLTYPFVLKSLTALGENGVGGSVHCGVLKMGLEYDVFVRVCLVEMYVKIELVVFALQLFDESPERNKAESVLLWNIAINGCCKTGQVSKALALFEEMPERNAGSWNTLLSGLLRNGEVDKAMELFDGMVEKNVVSWTCMIHGLTLNGLHQKALDLFFKMVEEGTKPNGLTVVSVLSACAKTGALEAGRKIHENISNNKLHLNVAVGNALLDMYAKCGYIESAGLVFSGLKEKDIRTWSIMIWGWAIHGHVDKALRCFEQMRLAGIKPDEVSFLAVLTGCSHAGRVDQGLQIFDSMQRECSIEPTMKHYAVVVDLLGRAGRLDEAFKFIESMPLEPDYVIWGALFSACRAHKNIEMAKVASQKLLQLEPKHAGGHVFLSNVYAGAGRWDDVERVRSLMKNKNVDKDPGWSSMEVDGQLHTFVAGDNAHTRKQEIYSKLEEIITGAKQHGYMPETEWVLHNIDEEEKEGALGSHSEKLALAFGLISTGPGAIIMIVKNLRVCGDCHSLMKYVSKMSERVIVLRDIKRFHHFKDGVCSCKDYW
ncbi:pentatricopeptide repeat-containing protein At1g04840-like [Nicotiana tabacum]|uniref:Pentatricopeptide repeat-containing protein At1g04840-like n=4 Tax=Nicotiana TaxID=4085 RepID=A0A1S3ZFN2_TOBAC|nr:PREDICTED: pentatricopeptide repeat-containing protein At1g04840 [Nicotiana sylvestris]XP_009768192.1 PREDICTED: pentatricopeptide repeat-containing protein At1g04840 [Nicotiana sylvestris]XP_009768194.1 PREDICTED: pentatricopeptide repeat-containing protein At1g04840 [Nicotiana sylvestris]XP_016463288.1 PREDICTED: pentatricopeptide repeat-containing protein At1g04840-like [Nicotiana tabacum]XP_016463289.1 PREDICTED: pentatricopeptide repeat-containing protein At1g04840-like [Nicotiana tabac